MELVLLAAGVGSRYGGLKQLDRFGKNKQTFMEFSIYDALNVGFDKVLFIIRKDVEQEFSLWIKDTFDGKLNYEFVFQELNCLPEEFKLNPQRKKPWGTAHALYCAKEKIKDDFLIINADDFYGQESYNIAYKFLNQVKEEHVLIGYNLAETLSENGYISRGICKVDKNNNLFEIDEIKKIKKNSMDKIVYLKEEKEILLDPTSIVSMNMFAFRKEILNYIESYIKDFFKNNIEELSSEVFIPLMVDELIKDKKIVVNVLKTPSNWFGVTYKEDKETVNLKIDSLIEKGVYPKQLF